MDEKKKLITSGAIVIVCIIICVLFYGSSIGHLKATITDQTNQIADLKNELDIKSNQQTSTQIKLEQDATGLQLDRVSSDDKMMKDFLTKCLTWNSGEEYDKMRADLFQTYGISEDSSFAKTFLPKNIKTEDGKYNYIDTHNANSKFEEMSSYVSHITPDSYSYFTYVTWTSADGNGNEGSSTCAFTYDITTDGKLENLNAYTIAD